MSRILDVLRRLIPKPIFEFFQPAYHYLLAFLAAMFFGFPARRMIIIGVTGTKGKTTTCNLIHHILASSGHKTGLSTTINFKIGDEEWRNDLKQTMPGRFCLQRFLSRMLKAGCRYAVIETSSEGILQYRHRFIDYDAAVFLNLSPEHLDRHGSFENYRNTKIKLFEKVAQKDGGVGIYNLDDENVKYFIKPRVAKKYGFTISGERQSFIADSQLIHKLPITDCKIKSDGIEFKTDGYKFKSSLLGKFNIYNSAAAICAALSQNISIEQIQKSLLTFQPPIGRMEIIDVGQNFSVIVDYAHEPKGLESVYKAIAESKLKAKNSKLICLLGAAGGGRDKWKRPEMGRIAAQYCDEIILTDEDPYNEQPEMIINDIASGCSQIRNPKSENRKQNYFKIIDRREAIKKAISLAKKGDAVILTGKGGEVWMCAEKGKKIPWDEKKIVEEILRESKKGS